MELLPQEAARQRRRCYRLILLGLGLVLLAAILLSFWIGYFPLTPVEVVRAFLSRFTDQTGLRDQAVTIFWNIRLPRILSAVLIGASLSVAGATYQGMFRNPLVSPDILGVSSGASLGRCRWPEPPIRACSAIPWSRRTFWACPRAPAWGPPWPSSGARPTG